MRVVLAIDQSTSGTKGLLFSLDGKLLARADVPHRQITNEKGWVEHDPEEIYANTLQAVKDVLAMTKLMAEAIAAIGISNQRETAVCWEKKTGKPLYNAIVWQCARATDIVDAVEAAGLKDAVREKTGLTLSPFFSAAKWGWMAKHIPEVTAAGQNLTLCCGTIDAWLVYKLTGNHKTDYSNASRTQLLNLHTRQWDTELAKAFGIDPLSLPEICYSDSLFGYTTLGGLLPHPVPIHGVLGDSHAALFGNACRKPGMAKVTYGTGSSVMMNVGTQMPKVPDGVVASLAWGIGGTVDYVLEGNINYTGAVTKWLVDDIAFIESSRQAGDIAQTVSSTGGVYLVPAFSGLGAPYFNNEARAAFLGMNRSTKKAHLVRAAEECIAFQIADVVRVMQHSGNMPSVLRADGGPTRDAFLMQFQADILGLPLEISEVEELSGFGAAACAAIGAGISDETQFFANRHHHEVRPNMAQATRNEHLEGWTNAIKLINGR